MIKGVIWSCDRDGDGIEKLKYIRDRYIWSGINPVQEVYSRSNSWIAFENGDHWKVVGASESSRGVRCNYAWIDSRASEEFVRCVIMALYTMNSSCQGVIINLKYFSNK